MRKSKDFSMHEWRALEKGVEELTGFHFKNEDLLKQAFVRKSYSSQFGGENNEKLEFFGDSILNYQVSKAINKRFGYVKTSMNHGFDGNTEYSFIGNESDFTRLKNGIVSNKTLADIIDETGLMEYLIVGKSDFINEVDTKEKIKGDLFEAILGAVAVQCSWDDGILEKVVYKMLNLEELLKQDNSLYYKPKDLTLENAISVLKELAEKGECSMPNYDISGPDMLGKDINNQPIWGCTCTVSSWGQCEQVFAHNKKDAKKCSAYLVLISYYCYPNDYGPNCTKPNMQWLYENNELKPGSVTLPPLK